MFNNQMIQPAALEGIVVFLWLLGLPAILIMVWREHKGNLLADLGLTKLVLQKFSVNESGRPAVEVVGRLPGVIAWMLELLRVEPQVRFVLTDSEIYFQAASLSGTRRTYIPLEKVSSTTCGYARSIVALGITLFCAYCLAWRLLEFLMQSLGVVNLDQSPFFPDDGFIWLIVGAVAAVRFFLSERIAVVVRAGNHGFGFLFKRSVMENMSVDLPTALRAIEAINARVRAAQPSSTNPANMAPPADQRPRPWREAQ